jgi:hypothetical protein
LSSLPHGLDIYLANVKTMKKFPQIFVAFSEKLNITCSNLNFDKFLVYRNFNGTTFLNKIRKLLKIPPFIRSYLTLKCLTLHLQQLWKNTAKLKVDYVLMVFQGDFFRTSRKKLINKPHSQYIYHRKGIKCQMDPKRTQRDYWIILGFVE